MVKGSKAGLKHLMGLIKGVMVSKAEMANQNDDVETEGEAGQGQGIGGGRAVGAPGSRTVRIGTAVAAVGEADGTVESDDWTLRERGIAAKAGATGQTGGELRATDPLLCGVGIDFGATHRGTSSCEDNQGLRAQCSTPARTPLMPIRTFPLP